MNSETTQALNQINRTFYDDAADQFSRTRAGPWPGWQRVVEAFERHYLSVSRHRQPSILDLGCGNGRFLLFLERHLHLRFVYLGIDSSPSLLHLARTSASSEREDEVHFLQRDVVGEGLPGDFPDRTFSLIVLFGLLHHVPSFERRRSLLQRLATRLEPGGLLAMSVWQFGAAERFHDRIIPWEDHNREADPKIDPSQLEPGDVLLRWGQTVREGGVQPRRYCHFSDPAEAERLVSFLDLERVETFLADGKSGDLNLYCLLQRAPARPGRARSGRDGS